MLTVIVATAASARPVNISQSDAMTSNLGPSNDVVAEFQVRTPQPILTTALIKADYTCMTNNAVTPLLECIWKYSSRHAFLPATPIELAAGHRYWLSNKLLADEWMMIFLFVPRLLDSAPPEVRAAFDNQVYNLGTLSEIGLGSFADVMEQEDYIFTPPSGFRSTQFTRQPFQHGFPPVQSTQHVPQGHMQLASSSVPGLHSGISSIPSVSVFPLQPVPSGAAAFEQNPAAPPIFHQLLRAQGITDPGFRPGSVLPKDNVNKAWSAERIRAFVQIQHKNINQLPPTAFSSYGTEMSNFRTPESIDVTCCPFETSLEENFTVSPNSSSFSFLISELTARQYFSNICTLNREMCVRASKHWQPMDIARYIVSVTHI
jgi:hypothetical protein